MSIELPNSVELILSRLNDCGYEAYIVGGCVRDLLIGSTPNDWDICTSALPEEIKEVFDDYRIIPTGLKHGTVIVVIDVEQFEITTYRTDGDYADHRHPQEVLFTNSLRADLSRRDFTINAMAYNPKMGLVDYFDGRKDIKRGIIRCVGNPDERFNEDALRIMRAVRFSSVLGYKIESKTYDSIYKNKELLKEISVERINSEFVKAIKVSYNRELADLIQIIVPEITNAMIDESLRMVGAFGIPYYTRLALIFNFDKEKQRCVLRKLKFDNKTIKNVQDTHEFIYKFRECKFYNSPRYFIKTMLNRNDVIAYDVIEGIRCTSRLDEDLYYQLQSYMLQKHLNECINECYKLSQLKVNGNDMVRIGFSGREIGVILNKILEAVLLDIIPNERDKLIEYAIKIKECNS